jgi:HK97 family phage portal protein
VKLEGQRITYVLNGRTEHGLSDILHIRAMSLDGIRGMSPVEQCRTALGLNENLRESGRQFFEQGSRPSGVLIAPPGASDGYVERLEEKFKSKHGGIDRLHKVVVLDGEHDFKPISFSASDNEFLAQREFSTREVCRIFRVPAWAVDGATGDSLTYANVQEQARALVTSSLRPWIVRIETASRPIRISARVESTQSLSSTVCCARVRRTGRTCTRRR